jgi:hypothetical protein
LELGHSLLLCHHRWISSRHGRHLLLLLRH